MKYTMYFITCSLFFKILFAFCNFTEQNDIARELNEITCLFFVEICVFSTSDKV